MLKVMVIGAVNSAAQVIRCLVKHNLDVVGILGHEPKDPGMVSGWVNLEELAADYGIEYKGYQRINDSSHLEWAIRKNPDIIFAVGFSQLINDDWLSLPRLGCVGFHPTRLPEG